MSRVFISAGSNMGDRYENLSLAQHEICRSGSVELCSASPVYETKPHNCPPQTDFLNQVWAVDTRLEPEELLTLLERIECDLGREIKELQTPRPIDLDILFFDNVILKSSKLEIPHPKIQDREFVLKPLADIAPKKIHPELRKTVAELFEILNAEN